MRAQCRPGSFSGTIRVPASKSHTIRRLLFASLADGRSVLEQPLDSLDTRSCLTLCRAFGAQIEELRSSDQSELQNPNPLSDDGTRLQRWIVSGIGAGSAGGKLKAPEAEIDVGNSGTTLYLALALAALGEGRTIFTGDEQIRRRSAEALLAALRGLGAEAYSVRDDGCAPIVVQGPWKGGRVSISCPTSQYLSALLIAAPLAPAGTLTEIEVPLLNEKPYVEMTLAYLDEQGIPYEAEPDYSFFSIPGGYSYIAMDGPIPGDFSSASFPACAAAVSGGPLTLLGLDPDDTQGDKAVFSMLEELGCSVVWHKNEESETAVTIQRDGNLGSAELNLNDTPDALPVLAAVACYGSGETGLVHVPNARIKETDRIAVMASELRKLGAAVEELSDGLIINGAGALGIAPLRGGSVRGHGDHRVVMALAVAALGAEGPVEVDSAEAAAVTYPGFLELLGADLRE